MTDSYNQTNINLSPSGGGGGGGGGIYDFDAIWIDSATPVALAAQDGTVGAPFSTFAAAVALAEAKQDALPVGPLPSQRGGFQQTFIVAGGIYDEDLLLLRGNTFYEFLFIGPVYQSDDPFAPTTVRNIVWNNNQAVEDADLGTRRPQLIIAAAYDAGPTSGTHTAIASGWLVSGEIRLQNPGGAGQSTTAEVHLSHVKVFGNMTSQGATLDFGQRNVYLIRCQFTLAFNVPNAHIQWMYDTEITGTTTILDYGRIVDSELTDIVTTIGFAPGLPPGGFFNTNVNGDFTGPAASFHVDAYTNWFFKLSGGALLGGATKVIQGDLAP